MANQHRYGFRFSRSISGNETPQTMTRPIASGYAPNTGANGTGGTAVNLNIGDPIQLLNDGTVKLVQPGATVDGTEIENRVFGVVAGFPRVLSGGYPRPNGFYVSGTATAVGTDTTTLCKFIPVEGNIFEIDCDTTGQPTTKADWEADVGGTANFLYSPLTSGAGQPKANPLLDISDVTDSAAEINQLRIVGLGKGFDQQDPTQEFVSLEVVFNDTQIFPMSVGDVTANDEQPALADLEE